MNGLLETTYNTALNCDIPIISLDTSARILAILYVHGNNEFMVHCAKFKVEIDYIQKRFKIEGGEAPDREIIPLLKQYIIELEAYEQSYPDIRYPDWANDLFQKRYGIKLIN